MEFNKEAFAKNRLFILVTIIVIVVFVIISIFAPSSEIEEDILELPDKTTNNINKLIINEVLTSNDGSAAAPDGGIYDFVELYNGSSKDKNLTNYSLSDTSNEIKWVFPENTIIKKGEYLIVYLSGKKMDDLYASFKLKAAGGENLILRSSSKKVVDAVETVALSKGSVMGRNADGNFVIYDKSSPGYANDLDGYNAYIDSLKQVDEDGLIINEVLPRNDGNFKNELGKYSGYIELKNTKDKDIDLSKYSISDDLSKPFKYQLPKVTLSSGEIFIIYTSSSKSNDKVYNASFKLKSKTGDVVLSKAGHIVESYSYENLANGIGLVKEKDKFIETSDITPGFENTNYSDYQKELQVTPKTLVISEVMNNNFSYLPQNGGKYYDFIELYNNSDETIKLSDYCISKNDDSCNEILPNKELKPKEYYVVMASGNSSLSNDSYHHLNFKIGDTTGLYLYKNKKIVHAIFINNLLNGYSIGVSTNSGVFYFQEPTPGSTNKEGVAQIAASPSFSIKGGVYNNIESLEVAINGEGTIYYTTDGSKPTTSSKVYSEPLKLDKTTVLRAMSTNQNKRNSSFVTSSYIINENHEIEVMSIVLEPSDFSNIQSNAWVVDNEKYATAEFYAKDDTSYNVPCGFKLFGGSTRGHTRKSYSINFRKQYGEGTLEYKMFDNRNSATYESLVLRTASQDERHSFLRDIVGTSAVDGKTNLDVQSYRAVAMYINGRYWGFYYIREKVSEDFVSNHYNVDANGNTDIIRIDWEVKAGTSSKYASILSYIKSNDMTTKESYDYVNKNIDLTSFMDFYIASLFTTNNDIVNTRLFRSDVVEDGKWNYIFYDLDVAFYNMQKDYLSWMNDPNGMASTFNNTFFRGLLQNKTIKEEFIKRIAYNLREVWDSKKTTKILDDLLAKYEKEIIRSHERWGYDVDHWKVEVEDLRYYLENRKKPLLDNVKSFFKLSNTQMKDYFGDLYD